MGTRIIFVDAGSFCLRLFTCGYYQGNKTKSPKWIKSSQNTVLAVFGLVSLAGAILIYSFVVNDFHLQYVAEHSARNLSLAYRLSAFWAGQEGSLLLWEWLLVFFATILIVQNRRKNKELMPYVSVTMMGISLFFLVLLIFVNKLFHLLSFLPSDGRGLNPLLQNPGMVLHPPAVFLGYVGFSVPFAFAIAALLTKQLGNTWIISTRKWVLFPWLCLSIGNLLGAQWAYMELGWGGYWAWDPVENRKIEKG